MFHHLLWWRFITEATFDSKDPTSESIIKKRFLLQPLEESYLDVATVKTVVRFDGVVQKIPSRSAAVIR